MFIRLFDHAVLTDNVSCTAELLLWRSFHLEPPPGPISMPPLLITISCFMIIKNFCKIISYLFWKLLVNTVAFLRVSEKTAELCSDSHMDKVGS